MTSQYSKLPTAQENEVDEDDVVIYEQPSTPLLPQAEPAVLETTTATDEPSSSSSAPSTPPRIADRRQMPPSTDGVFTNLSAKPTTNVGDDFKEEDGPPPYETAAADATPPYFDMTVITAANAGEEILVDGLPVGSGFSFVWNMLVSSTFQFVGFLFTYLLHTSHAGKNGSKAGLGITLIQYGFYLRSHTTDEDTYPYYNNGPSAQIDSNAKTRTDLLSYCFMLVGWLMVLRSTAAYVRANKMQAIIAYHPETGAV